MNGHVTGPHKYHDRKIIQRGDPISAGAGFNIPEVGRYTVNLRVIFEDSKYGEQTAHFMLRDFLLVSIGDSFASGQGNPDSPGLVGDGRWKCEAATLSRDKGWKPDMHIQPKWVEKLAYRSMRGMHALAALSLNKTFGRTLDLRGKDAILDRITFISTARSGATVTAGLFNSQIQPPNKDFVGAGQLVEAQRTVAGRKIDALLVSIGGNDIGFSGVLTDLIKGDNVFTANDDNDPTAVLARIDALLKQLDTNYDRLKSDVDRLLAPRQVYINGYPTALFDRTNADGTIGFHACGIFQGWDLDIDSADYKIIKQKGKALNDLIKGKAGTFGWRFIDVAPDFVGHGYCDSDTLWVGATESCKSQGDFEGLLHPNRKGHYLASKKFSTELRKFSISRLVITPRPLPANTKTKPK